MTGSNTVHQALRTQIGEEGPAGAAGIVLGWPHGKATLVEGQTAAIGELSDEAGISVRSRAAELVIEVDDGEGDAGGGGELAEQMEEAH